MVQNKIVQAEQILKEFQEAMGQIVSYFRAALLCGALCVGILIGLYSGSVMYAVLSGIALFGLTDAVFTGICILIMLTKL